ncbi:CoA ester lyase [Streptomyces sp. NBC_00656]|uniref:HpcH/HpaI aldolase/citrate lyase family protein n=1 Tax=Streptomyces sp. NBC_00656 TaxID=2903668 RepID=UPI00324B83FA
MTLPPPFAARLAAARNLLFVPAHRPDRFAKAVASGADAIIIDLEDAVATADKDTARAHADAWLARGGEAVVRINAYGTPWFEDDLKTVAAHGVPIMPAKAEDSAVLEHITAVTEGRCALIPLIETAAGVENAPALCATAGVVRVAFGSVDLATQLGIRHDDRLAFAYVRSRLVMASAAAGIATPVDGVTTDLGDADLLAEDVAHARRLGFGAKLCVHPRQLAVVQQGFAPTDEEIAWARKVLGAGEAVSVVDGEMVDKPVLERARGVLDRVR